MATPSVHSDKRSGQPRRVLFVSHEASRTGAPMFLLHFMRWIRRETKLEFDLFLPKDGPLLAEFGKIAGIQTPAGFARNPDLLKQYGFIYVNSASCGRLVEMWNYGSIPIVTHIHELDCAYNYYGARHMASIIRQSNAYIACAEVVAQRLRHRFRIPEERMAVHYEMIDGEAVAKGAREANVTALREKYNLPAGDLIVAACGTFDFRKAPDLFVQMAARLRKKFGAERTLRFVWIGAMTHPELARFVSQDVMKLGLQDTIQFIGELPSPHGLLSLCDIFCLTSREDPFPLAMLEAASLGKPVVAFSGSGGAEEFCALGGGIAVPYLDLEAMAGACRDLLSDPDRCKAVGAQAAEIVRQRFTIEAVAPGLWNQLEQFLNSPPPTPPHRHTKVFTDIYATWLQEEAPQPEYVRAHFERQDVRKKARALLKSGRKQDAVESLLENVTWALSTKDPHIIMESLVEISEDLAPFDGKRAEVLLAEAEKIARSSGLKLDGYRTHPLTVKKETVGS